MTDFWKKTANDVSEPLTQETLDAAWKALIEQQDAYHRETPASIVYPLYMRYFK